MNQSEIYNILLTHATEYLTLGDELKLRRNIARTLSTAYNTFDASSLTDEQMIEWNSTLTSVIDETFKEDYLASLNLPGSLMVYKRKQQLPIALSDSYASDLKKML